MNRILLSLQTFSSPTLAEAPVAGAAALIQELLSNLLHLVFPLGLGLAVDVPVPSERSADWIPRLGRSGRVLRACLEYGKQRNEKPGYN